MGIPLPSRIEIPLTSAALPLIIIDDIGHLVVIVLYELE